MICASVWIAFETVNPPAASVSIERPVAETTPTVSELLLPERAADRGDRLADDDRGRVAEGDGVELVDARRDADHSDVAEEIPADHAAADPLAVGELDVDGPRALDVRPRLRGVRDHVRVGEDHPAAVDDEAGALRHPVDPEVRVDRDDTGGALDVERLRVEGRARAMRGRRRGRRRRGGDCRLDDRGRAVPEAGDRAHEQRDRRADRSGDEGDARCAHATHHGHRSNAPRVSM